jgi:hypothetical protein
LVEQVDLAKFMLLEVHGGFYVDTDIEPRNPIPAEWYSHNAIFTESYLGDICQKNHPCIFAMLPTFGIQTTRLFNNGFMAGQPRTKIYAALLDEAISLRYFLPRFIGHQLFVLYTAGPLFLSMYIARHLEKTSGVYFVHPHYIEGCGSTYAFSKDEKDCLLGDDTVGIHKHGLSWATPIHFFVFKCVYHRQKISRYILCSLAIILILGVFWATKKIKVSNKKK